MIFVRIVVGVSHGERQEILRGKNDGPRGRRAMHERYEDHHDFVDGRVQASCFASSIQLPDDFGGEQVAPIVIPSKANILIYM